MKAPAAVLAAILGPVLTGFPVHADALDPTSIRRDHFTGPGVHQGDGIGPDMAVFSRTDVISRGIPVALDGRLPLAACRWQVISSSAGTRPHPRAPTGCQ